MEKFKSRKILLVSDLLERKDLYRIQIRLVNSETIYLDMNFVGKIWIWLLNGFNYEIRYAKYPDSPGSIFTEWTDLENFLVSDDFFYRIDYRYRVEAEEIINLLHRQ